MAHLTARRIVVCFEHFGKGKQGAKGQTSEE